MAKSSFEGLEPSAFEELEASAGAKAERAPEILRNISFEPIRDGNGNVVGYKDSQFGRKAVELLRNSSSNPRSGETYEVRVLEDTDPTDLLKGKYVVELVRVEDEVKHREASRAKAERFRENPSFRTTAQIINGDPDLSFEYRLVTERAREFKEDQDEEEKHRMYSPMLAAMASSERGKQLLDLTIDRTVDRDSENIREELKKGNNYVPEVVIGSGVHGTIWNVTRQMYLPGNPALTVERDPKIGGQFAQYGRPVFRKNDRMRPELRDQEYLPGTAQALTTFTQFAPIQQADMGHEAYPFQDVTARSARINMFTAGRALANEELLSVNLNPDQKSLRPGQLPPTDILLEMRNRQTGKIEEVITDRLVFTSGIGKEKTRLNEKDPKTKEILEKAKKDFEAGRDVKAMSGGMLYQRVGNAAEPFPLKGYDTVVLSGGGDSAIVAAGVLLGYEGQVGKTSAQLDRVREIIWIGPDFMTKEEFIEKARARYHWVGLEFPREKFEEYYHRIRPVANVKVDRLEMDGDNVRVICKPDIKNNENVGEERRRGSRPAPRQREIAYEGDHYIYCHGFEDVTDSLVSRLNNTVYTNATEIESLKLDAANSFSFFRRVGSQIYYKTGAIKKLEVINVETDEEAGTFTSTYRLIDRKGNSQEYSITRNLTSILRSRLTIPKELVNKANISRLEFGADSPPATEPIYDFDSGEESPIGVRYIPPFGQRRNFSVLKAGPASRLPLTEDEKQRAPVLAEIPENTAAIFRYAPYTQALARISAQQDARRSRKAKGIFEIKEEKKKPEPMKPMEFKKKSSVPNFNTIIPATDITERLPYDVNSLDALRLAIGDQLFNARFPEDLKDIELNIIKMPSREKDGGIKYEIESTPPLPADYLDTFLSVFSDRLVGNTLNKLTDKNSNRDEAIQLTLPIHQGKLDAANIRYTVLRK